MGETWGQTGRTPFLQVHVCDEKLVNVPSVPMFFVPRGIQVGHAAQQNLGDSFPVFDNFDFRDGRRNTDILYDSDSDHAATDRRDPS